MIDIKHLAIQDPYIDVVSISQRKNSPDGRCNALIINLRKPIPVHRFAIVRETFSAVPTTASTIVVPVHKIRHLGPRLRKAIYDYLWKCSDIAVVNNWLSPRTRYIDIMTTYFHSNADTFLVAQANTGRRRVYMPKGDFSNEAFRPDVRVTVHGTSIDVEYLRGPALISDEEIMNIVSYLTLFVKPPMAMDL